MEIWETQQGHIFMGTGKFENKHGVGILVNKKWRKHINSTDYISERAISTSITVNKQHILLMSVYFHRSGYADHHIEKVYRSIEKLTNSIKKNLQNVVGDFNPELGPGYGAERVSVGPHTLKEGTKRGDWMKQWLVIQNFTAFNTMYRKTLEKQATYRTPKGTEKHLYYILIHRKHMYCSRDVEANDMIHMGSDHTNVMAQFVITAPKKEVSKKTHIARKKVSTAESTKSQDEVNMRSDESIKFEERYAELERKIKNEAEIAATTQNPKMIESLTMSQQAE